MNFIKSNLIFVLIMALALCGAVYLIILDITKHSDVVAINNDTQANQKKFDEAFRRPIKPVDLNIKKIEEDTEKLQVLVKNMQRMFGNPYRAALLAFAKKIKISEDILRESFRRSFEKTEQAELKFNAKYLTNKMIEDMLKEKQITKAGWQEAFKIFVTEAQKETVESLNAENGYDIFGVALGLPRTMNPTAAQQYLGVVQNQIAVQNMIPGAETMDDVRKFTFDKYKETMPIKHEIETILETMPILEDVFRRMKISGIRKVENFAPKGNVEIKDSYAHYHYSMKIVGSLDSIRKFMYDLQNAYKNNRVYTVTWVELKNPEIDKEVETMRSLLVKKEENRSSSYQETELNQSPRSKKRNRKRQKTTEKSTDVDFSENPGQIWIGLKTDCVEASVDITYTIFIGERLKAN